MPTYERICSQTSFGIRQGKMSGFIDIDNLELVLRHRQQDSIKKLLKIFAQEIASIINQITIENCTGCKNEHLSQTHHDCLTMEKDERLYRYFDAALERVSAIKIKDAYIQLHSDANDIEKWKAVIYTEQRQRLKQEIFHLL